jgi:hypothetical protein
LKTNKQTNKQKVVCAYLSVGDFKTIHGHSSLSSGGIGVLKEAVAFAAPGRRVVTQVKLGDRTEAGEECHYFCLSKFIVKGSIECK